MIAGKKKILMAALLAGVVSVMIFIQLAFSYEAVKATKNENSNNFQIINCPYWHDPNLSRLKKDISWYEQLLTLSRSDSMYLCIDLSESLVHLRLKGMNMVETKIMGQHPANFLAGVNETTYLHFAAVNSIAVETANFPKKPVRKVVAYINQNDENKAGEDSVPVKPLRWSFTSGNSFRVIFTGVPTAEDSILNYPPVGDILRYRFADVVRQPVPKKYIPTLFLWLNDKDAKAIYKALPSKGKVLFRN